MKRKEALEIVRSLKRLYKEQMSNYGKLVAIHGAVGVEVPEDISCKMTSLINDATRIDNKIKGYEFDFKIKSTEIKIDFESNAIRVQYSPTQNFIKRQRIANICRWKVGELTTYIMSLGMDFVNVNDPEDGWKLVLNNTLFTWLFVRLEVVFKDVEKAKIPNKRKLKQSIIKHLATKEIKTSYFNNFYNVTL